MALEATVLCIDNSEWMRNGDFSPSRFEALQDACISICGSKTRQNPENSVGLIASAGRAVEVCVPLTQDLGKLIAALHKVKISGESNFVGSIRVAQLALRHRQKTGKKQEQRIVLFVGSPVDAEVHELEDIGKQLKKNSIAIDIISFGEPNAQQNEGKLQALLNAANNTDESAKDNSHFITLPSGSMSDILVQMTGDQPGSAPPIDLDPELIWAMELSKQTFAQENKTTPPTTTTTAQDKDVEMKDHDEPSPAALLASYGIMEEEADPEFLEAIALSLQAGAIPATSAPAAVPVQVSTSASAPTTSVVVPSVASTVPASDMEEDDLAEALRLSQETASEDKKRDEQKHDKKDEKKEEKSNEHRKDEMELDMSSIGSDIMESVLMELPIDKDDPEVQKLLQAFKKDEKK